MYLKDVLSALLRRWPLTLVGLLVTAGLCMLGLHLVPREWTSQASVLLLPPKSSLEPGGNPYLQLSGLSPTLDVLAAKMSDADSERAAAAVSRSATYVIKADTTSSGPVLLVTVTDPDAFASLRVRDTLVSLIPTRLNDMQNSLGIAAPAHITSQVITQDPTVAVVGKSQLRVVVVAAAAGLGGTALVVNVIDGMLLRRRPRSAEAASEGSENVVADLGSDVPSSTGQGEDDRGGPDADDTGLQPWAWGAEQIDDADAWTHASSGTRS